VRSLVLIRLDQRAALRFVGPSVLS